MTPFRNFDSIASFMKAMYLSRSDVDGRPSASDERNSAETLIFLPSRLTHCSIRRLETTCLPRFSWAPKNPICRRFFSKRMRSTASGSVTSVA